MEPISHDVVAAYGRGTAGISELQSALIAAWKDVRDSPALRARAALLLELPEADVEHMEEPPVRLEAAGSGLGAGAIFAVVLFYIGEKVFLGAAVDKAKAVVKAKAEKLWNDQLHALFKKKLPRMNSLGPEVRRERT